MQNGLVFERGPVQIVRYSVVATVVEVMAVVRRLVVPPAVWGPLRFVGLVTEVSRFLFGRYSKGLGVVGGVVLRENRGLDWLAGPTRNVQEVLALSAESLDLAAVGRH